MVREFCRRSCGSEGGQVVRKMAREFCIWSVDFYRWSGGSAAGYGVLQMVRWF